MEDLADVAVGPSPDQLVPPRLLHAIRQLAQAAPATRSRNDDGEVTQTVTHTPQPTHPSTRITGRPPASSASARSPTGHARAHTPHDTPWNLIHRSGPSSRRPIS